MRQDYPAFQPPDPLGDALKRMKSFGDALMNIPTKEDHNALVNQQRLASQQQVLASQALTPERVAQLHQQTAASQALTPGQVNQQRLANALLQDKINNPRRLYSGQNPQMLAYLHRFGGSPGQNVGQSVPSGVAQALVQNQNRQVTQSQYTGPGSINYGARQIPQNQQFTQSNGVAQALLQNQNQRASQNRLNPQTPQNTGLPTERQWYDSLMQAKNAKIQEVQAAATKSKLANFTAVHGKDALTNVTGKLSAMKVPQSKIDDIMGQLPASNFNIPEVLHNNGVNLADYAKAVIPPKMAPKTTAMFQNSDFGLGGQTILTAIKSHLDPHFSSKYFSSLFGANEAKTPEEMTSLTGNSSKDSDMLFITQGKMSNIYSGLENGSITKASLDKMRYSENKSFRLVLNMANTLSATALAKTEAIRQGIGVYTELKKVLPSNSKYLSLLSSMPPTERAPVENVVGKLVYITQKFSKESAKHGGPDKLPTSLKKGLLQELRKTIGDEYFPDSMFKGRKTLSLSTKRGP